MFGSDLVCANCQDVPLIQRLCLIIPLYAWDYFVWGPAQDRGLLILVHESNETKTTSGNAQQN